MGSIRDINQTARFLKLPVTLWRDELVPARFRQALFHVESGAKENGRRIVTHQFPKKELPYSEDMGREAKTFTVRGYCICYPFDTAVDLYKRDYRIARDALIDALESLGPGPLQLPTFPKSPLYVVCPRYRVTEENRAGGFAVFDMSFTEYGFAPAYNQPVDPTSTLIARSAALRQQVKDVMGSSPRRTAPPSHGRSARYEAQRKARARGGKVAAPGTPLAEGR
jgi:prophage DNA circulation protein